MCRWSSIFQKLGSPWNKMGGKQLYASGFKPGHQCRLYCRVWLNLEPWCRSVAQLCYLGLCFGAFPPAIQGRSRYLCFVAQEWESLGTKKKQCSKVYSTPLVVWYYAYLCESEGFCLLRASSFQVLTTHSLVLILRLSTVVSTHSMACGVSNLI